VHEPQGSKLPKRLEDKSERTDANGPQRPITES
jgi:hypothetical protein